MNRDEAVEFSTPFPAPERVPVADRPPIASQIENLSPVAKPVVAPPLNRPLTDGEDMLSRRMKRHQAAIFRAIRPYVGGFDAECVVADAFRKFAETHTDGWDEGRKRGWLIKTAKRLAINFARKETSEAKRWEAAGLAGLVPVDLSEATERDVARWRGRETVDLSSQEVLSDRLEALRMAIDKLPDVHRAIVVDYHLEERPAKEVAERCDLCVGSVHRKLKQALKSLEEMIPREFE